MASVQMLESKEKNTISIAFYILSSIAIYTVIMAHCTYNNSNVQRISDLFGTAGVPIFLIRGGYFYNNNDSFSDFIWKKMRRIVVPWIVWGCLTFFLHTISDGGFSLRALALWIIGYKTWLYFVPVLLVCYLVFRISTNRFFCIAVAIVSIIVYCLTVTDVLNPIFITDCQNAFNWIFFFALGILMKDSCFIHYLYQHKRFGCALAVTLAITIGIIYYWYCYSLGITPSYWNWFSIPFELICFVSFFLVSVNLASKCCSFLVDVGKNTYIIFFTHMQIGINLINIILFRIWDRTDALAYPMVLLRPLAVLMITYFVFVIFVNRVGKLLRLKKHLWIIGL